MTLNDAIRDLRALVYGAQPAADHAITRIYAGDRMSDLLNHATDGVLLVTSMSNSALGRLVELMDVRSLCLLNGVEPEPALVETARAHDATIVVSPCGMFETCGRLYQLLRSEP